MNKTIKAWYFSTDDCILQYGDGRKIKEGVIHKVDEPIKLCERGLHASLTPFEALYYALVVRYNSRALISTSII